MTSLSVIPRAEIAGRRQLPFELLQISERTSQHNDSPDIRRNYLTALSAFQRFIHTGNIAEWTWRHAGGEENTYVFSYDGLSRLTDTRQYQAGERTDRFVERSLTYDRNGNILPLQRSQGDAVTTDFAYTYTGNHLVSLSDSRTAYPYAYDTIREYLVNTMRPLIFSTALPPFQIAWTSFIWEQLPSFTKERENLLAYSRLLAEALTGKGGEISQSHIIPFIVGESEDCVRKAEELQRKGFYCLPVRPPTVPKGTSRIRFSLTANLTIKNIHQLIVETGRALSPTGTCPVSTPPDR